MNGNQLKVYLLAIVLWLSLISDVNCEFQCNGVGRFLKPNTNCEEYILCQKLTNGYTSNQYTCPSDSYFNSITARCEAGYKCPELVQPRQTIGNINPMGPGQMQGVPTTLRPGASGATTPRPGATTQRPPGAGVPGPITTTTKPTQQPTVVLISTLPPPTTTTSNILAIINNRAATTKAPPAPVCPAACLMQTKTGIYPFNADPCSNLYVSCTRTADILYCASMKCASGQVFLASTLRCAVSSSCPKPKSS